MTPLRQRYIDGLLSLCCRARAAPFYPFSAPPPYCCIDLQMPLQGHGTGDHQTVGLWSGSRFACLHLPFGGHAHPIVGVHLDCRSLVALSILREKSIHEVCRLLHSRINGRNDPDNAETRA